MDGEKLKQGELNKEKTIIIGVELGNQEISMENSLDELEELVKAAGGSVEVRLSQRKDVINAALFKIGRAHV